MLYVRRVVGNSMLPALRPNDIVVSLRYKKPKINSIVIFKRPERELIKRIKRIEHDEYFVQGDNVDQSTDSREFGLVSQADILGVIVMKIRFATPTKAPKPTRPNLLWIPYVAAVLWTGLLFLHLFFFEQFVAVTLFAFNVAATNLGISWVGDGVAARIYAAIFIISMALSLPFLLRMQLSPLARIGSILSLILATMLYVVTRLLFLRKGYTDFYAYGSLLFTINVMLVTFASLIVLNAKAALGSKFR